LSDGSQHPVFDPSAGAVAVMTESKPTVGFTLAWLTTCQGLFSTVCTATLYRVRVPDGTTTPLAVAAQATVKPYPSAFSCPVAISPDNQRVAIASPRGIYVEPLFP